MQDVFITGCGKFLPGKPVSNAQAEKIIGKIHGVSSRHRPLVQRQNGIKTRYYAIDEQGNVLFSNAQMAANAIKDASHHAKLDVKQIEFLATGTTQGDLLVPGLASAVHAELNVPPIEIASFQSVCASSLMAVKMAWLQIKSGLSQKAAVSGSEFSSCWFQPKFYEKCVLEEEAQKPLLDFEFLRWTLSDGAGALILEDVPHETNVSLRIDWIEQHSFADRFPVCMYAGSPSNKKDKYQTWNSYDSPIEGWKDGALILRQDFELLYKMFPVWLGYYISLLEKYNINPTDIDYFLPHYSSQSLGEELKRLLIHADAMIPEERWFTNLSTCGNIGTASIFVILEEFIKTKTLNSGDTILCFVPESGRCVASFMHLTVT